LSLSTTQEEIKAIKDNIANKTNSNSRENLLVQLLDHITIAKSGSESSIGIDTFFLIIEANKNAAEKLLEIHPLLDKFETLKRHQAEIENNKRSQESYVDDKDQVTKALSDFPEYERVEGLLKDKNTKKTELEESVIKINKQLD